MIDIVSRSQGRLRILGCVDAVVFFDSPYSDLPKMHGKLYRTYEALRELKEFKSCDVTRKEDGFYIRCTIPMPLVPIRTVLTG